MVVHLLWEKLNSMVIRVQEGPSAFADLTQQTADHKHEDEDDDEEEDIVRCNDDYRMRDRSNSKRLSYSGAS
jgi:hypothetical protein